MIKKYANSATTEYMTSREVRFLCLINKDGYKDVPRLMIEAKNNKLTLGRVITTSSSFDFEDLSVNNGDCLIELIGFCIPNTKHLLTDMRNMSRNVDCIITDADSISVSTNKNFSLFSSSVSHLVTNTHPQNIFKDARCSRVMNSNCSLCVIKPHIVRSQQVGELLKTITDDRRFEISALFTVHLTTPLAEELFEVYRGIVPNYTLALEQICSAPVLAVMITTPNDEIDVVTEFRALAGPVNPALAKVVRPQSLRGLYGVDETKNAVHCTDLPEDGEMECKYIFETIASL